MKLKKILNIKSKDKEPDPILEDTETGIINASQSSPSEIKDENKEITISDFYINRFGNTADAEICILLYSLYMEMKKLNGGQTNDISKIQ